jgi:anhydro-N-acetylmuramic acid kinase
MTDRLKYLSQEEWLSKPRIVCGLMSGTSLDGVDAALVKFSISNGKHLFELLAFEFLPFDELIKNKIYQVISKKITIREVSELNFRLSSIYSKAILQLSEKSGFSLSDIDLIGLHGQTVWHEPVSIKRFASTLQLGSAPALATILNIPVINDFRSADIALAGQGAPLVPIFDKEFLSDEDRDVICLNIGGISNIT